MKNDFISKAIVSGAAMAFALMITVSAASGAEAVMSSSQNERSESENMRQSDNSKDSVSSDDSVSRNEVSRNEVSRNEVREVLDIFGTYTQIRSNRMQNRYPKEKKHAERVKADALPKINAKKDSEMIIKAGTDLSPADAKEGVTIVKVERKGSADRVYKDAEEDDAEVRINHGFDDSVIEAAMDSEREMKPQKKTDLGAYGVGDEGKTKSSVRAEEKRAEKLERTKGERSIISGFVFFIAFTLIGALTLDARKKL